MTIIQSLTPDQLDERLRNVVRHELKNLATQVPEEKLLTRTQAAQFLNVSLPTISSWEKQGYVKSHRVGTRVFFKQSDLLK